MGCSWCVRDADGSVLEEAYCAVQTVCYFGHVDFPDPYAGDELIQFPCLELYHNCCCVLNMEVYVTFH